MTHHSGQCSQGAAVRRNFLVALCSTPLLAVAQVLDDGLLYDRVHRRLNNHRSLRIRDLKVEVKDGVVTVHGIVRTEKLKARAAKVASMKGVKQVINRLVVSN